MWKKFLNCFQIAVAVLHSFILGFHYLSPHCQTGKSQFLFVFINYRLLIVDYMPYLEDIQLMT